MAFYNTSSLEGASVTDPISLIFTFVADNTSMVFGLLILATLFIIVVTNIKNFPNKEIFAIGCWFVTVLGIIMLLLGWISGIWVYLGIVLTGLFAVIFTVIDTS